MMKEREIPKAGEFYLHFKGKLYQIVTVAKHTETEEDLVIYQALYGTFGTYARPLSMFMSRVDQKKYPDVKQEYRFEKVVMEKSRDETFLTEEKTGQCKQEERKIVSQPKSEQVDMEPLFQFLDAGDLQERLNVLIQYRNQLTESMLDSMGIAIDCVLNGRNAEEKYYELDKIIRTKLQYEKKPR